MPRTLTAFYFVLTSLASVVVTPQQWQRAPVLPFVSLVYLYFAVRRLYRETWYHAALESATAPRRLFLAELAVALWASMIAVAVH